MITLLIGEASPSLNALVGQHWSKYRVFRKHWGMLVLEAKNHSNIGHWPAFAKSRLHIIRESPRKLDPDNFIGGLKVVIDGLKDCGLIEDDTTEHIVLVPEQRAVHGISRTLIEIEAI